MIKFAVYAILLAIILYNLILFGADLLHEFVCYRRKRRHQKEWNSQKRKMELEGKTEGQIREAYFEYCKKIAHSKRDCFGWGFPDIGHINVRRCCDGSEAVAE